MCIKPHRILIIEPDTTRAQLLRSIVQESASAAEFQVVASAAEARSLLEESRPVMLYSALPFAEFPDEAGSRCEPELSAAANPPADNDGHAEQLAEFAHGLRGSLGIIQNSVFILRRKGAGDNPGLNEFLDLIEQQVSAVGQALTDHVGRASRGTTKS
jgi:hypothetical protein